MKHLRDHINYANVVSTLCLFILLGGAAYGAARTVLPRNSVGPRQLKPGAVRTRQIKAKAVNGAKVADGSLTGADLADGSVSGADLASGSVTATDLADASVTGAVVADGSLATAELADAAVDSAKVRDRSLGGTDVAPDSLTGAEIDESTLGTVPEAESAIALGRRPASSFLSSTVYKNESPEEVGRELGDGTFAIEEGCKPNDVLLTGGPADVSAYSQIVESFPTPGSLNSWKVRIKPTGTDKFMVVVLCVDQ